MNDQASQLVTDPFLSSILTTTAALRSHVLTLLDAVVSNLGTAKSIHELPDASQVAISKQQKLLNSYLSQLRGLNREAALRIRQTKQDTAESRSEVDRLHLQLQNLYYEQRHLRGEIRACEEYPHLYMQLPMIPQESFLDKFPIHTSDDENQLMRARIEHEYNERVELEDQRQELLKRKQVLLNENAKRKDGLAKLDKELESFIEVPRVHRFLSFSWLI